MRKYRAAAVVVVARPSGAGIWNEARARAGAPVSEKTKPASRRERPDPIPEINNNYSLEMSIQGSAPRTSIPATRPGTVNDRSGPLTLIYAVRKSIRSARPEGWWARCFSNLVRSASLMNILGRACQILRACTARAARSTAGFANPSTDTRNTTHAVLPCGR